MEKKPTAKFQGQLKTVAGQDSREYFLPSDQTGKQPGGVGKEQHSVSLGRGQNVETTSGLQVHRKAKNRGWNNIGKSNRFMYVWQIKVNYVFQTYCILTVFVCLI